MDQEMICTPTTPLSTVESEAAAEPEIDDDDETFASTSKSIGSEVFNFLFIEAWTTWLAYGPKGLCGHVRS